MKVVIIGCGPAGLVSALSLLDQNTSPNDFILLENRPVFAHRPQVIGVLAAASASLRRWNVLQKMEAGVSARGGRVSWLWQDHKSDAKVNVSWAETEGEFTGDLHTLTIDQASDDNMYLRNINYSTIGDVERIMLDIVLERGVKIVRGVTTDLVWHKETEKYEVCYTTGSGERISAGIPDLVINCEGASRKLVNQELIPRHGIKITPESPLSAYYVYVNIVFPTDDDRMKAVPPGLYFKKLNSDLLMLPVPKKPEAEQPIWVKLRPDMIQGSNLWKGAPADSTLDWSEGPRSKVIEDFATTQIRDFLETLFSKDLPVNFSLGAMTRPIQVRDTILSKTYAGTNIVCFGDSARTGTFESGSGLNILLTVDTNALKVLLSHLPNNVSAQAFEQYHLALKKNAEGWHRRNRMQFYTPGVPPFVPYAEQYDGPRHFNNYDAFVEGVVKPAMRNKKRSSQPRL
ncbi:hypothetical protein SmJEL517_g06083 [Synchytrium microbalum]|uniref:FAD-binding domain-containing protein n=1 Tax=Synchytrium microbalum TaxID=1806994 RepID=A0A507BYI1_9FUNG|nr:uncharacterized protein SmJEL517_g06083 [Synchytrium microbalum]TPX30333.1 hypothetical protein SmJEL517_g06083 [Synchytrium microbalum]